MAAEGSYGIYDVSLAWAVAAAAASRPASGGAPRLPLCRNDGTQRLDAQRRGPRPCRRGRPRRSPPGPCSAAGPSPPLAGWRRNSICKRGLAHSSALAFQSGTTVPAGSALHSGRPRA
eukprot:355968-Chlamydomonas_euryale.AAC.2